MMAQPPPARASNLRRLSEVGRALTYANSLQNVLDLTVECALDLLGADKAILLLTEDDGLLRVRAHRGIDERATENFREQLDETLIARLKALLGEKAKQHFLGVPLVVRGKVIGMIAVHRESAEPAGEDGEWLLSALADQASIALDAAGHLADQAALEHELWMLEDRRRSLQSALAVASHDLRTPLNSLQGYIELLSYKETGPLNPDQRELLEKARTVGRHFQSVLEDVLAMARLTSGSERLATRDVLAGDVVREALVLAAPAAEAKGVSLVADVDPAVVMRADPDRVRQVLLHLLDNAVKYSDPDTVVRISSGAESSDDEGWVRIAVSDEGPGIPTESAEKAFEPYRRLDSDNPGNPGGTGLGLAIARALIVLMGGTIGADPDTGSGARIVFRLPSAVGDVSSDGESAEHERANRPSTI